ncbi:hypothetical protein C7B82_01970 [Stenomitos frigidus ULC18]|uniref:EF-hand domain-containing protein n=1 Tax=Stenomitos frigidus ULC18 TaxID=2107698 RepID=A0A2T1EPP3_9CYAN|nr:hypothetical protein C7B82_01970 [Stenomitos frigidus ULC18]
MRVLLCVALLLLALWVPRTLAVETPPPIEPFLMTGKFAEGEAAMLARLKETPEDDQARFSLGVTQLMSGVERLTQSLYRYGLRHNSLTSVLPFLRLPIPENPKPQVIRYEDTRQILQTFLNDLATVRTTLAPIKDPKIKLPLKLSLIRLDLNGDGKVEPTESLWRIFATINRLRVTEQQAKGFTITFDAADAIWLQGYTNLLGAIGEFALAHDGQEFFNALAHVVFTKPETPYPFLVAGRPEPSQFSFGGIEAVDIVAFVHLLHFPIAEPARMATALQHLQTTTALSRQSWKLITAETDNDREWLPNPKQKGVIPGARITQAMIDSWLAFLDQADGLMAGKTLVPFWRSREIRGVNLRKAFLEPRTTDVVLWLQGTAAAPYLEVGKMTDRQAWTQLAQTFRGQFFSFAAWFN